MGGIYAGQGIDPDLGPLFNELYGDRFRRPKPQLRVYLAASPLQGILTRLYLRVVLDALKQAVAEAQGAPTRPAGPESENPEQQS